MTEASVSFIDIMDAQMKENKRDNERRAFYI